MIRCLLFLSLVSLSSCFNTRFRRVIGIEDKDCVSPRDRGEYCQSGTQLQMFYYNKAQGLCQPFMFNGCNGNGNKYATIAECRDYCINGAGTRAQFDPAAQALSESAAMKAACSADYDTEHLTPVKCSSGQPCSEGNDCKQGYCCPNADFLCNLDYDTGKFAANGGHKSDKYFWTPQYNTCMRFSFYGSLGNANNFKDYNSCMRMCGSQKKQ